MSTAIEWTLDGFVDHFDFVHHKMRDHKFVWVLGAGASYASGIPLGSELVDQWLKQMHLKEDGGKTSLRDWATAEKLGIVGFKFDQRASFYPKVYQRRFRDYPEEGYAYLESIMSGKDPSPGYSILADALAADPPRHNIVITTNFDNLVADALSIYTDTFPFICGHESLTAFVRVSMRRPLICKIHRDLLLGPQNDPRSLRRLHDAWGMALRALFQHYTPIFIGYGGNDDTLMDLLESLQPGDIKGQMIWSYYEGGTLNERITNTVADHKGILVPVPDFDLLMVLLGERMGISLLDEEIGRRSDQRTQRYRDRVLRLDTVKHPSVTKALAATLERSGGWWAWEQKARSENDLDRRETVYSQGIQHCPLSAELLGNFALFFWKNRNNHDEAERLYRKTIELDPKNAIHTSNFASFMWRIRNNHSEAERLYLKAFELDPKNAQATGNYATFQWQVRGNHEDAERLYRRCIELDPKLGYSVTNFGNFLWQVRGNLDEAEPFYRKGIKLDPKNADLFSRYANFLWHARSDLDQAEKMYCRALELNPKDANNVGNFAGLLLVGGRLHKAAEQVASAREFNQGNKNQLQAELLFYAAVLSRLQGRDDTSAIHELSTFLSNGFTRSWWSFDGVLSLVHQKLLLEDHALYSALAAWTLDEKKVPDVDALLRQRANNASISGKGKKLRRKPSPLGVMKAREIKKILSAPSSEKPIEVSNNK